MLTVPDVSSSPGMIEVEFAAGARVRITGMVDMAVLSVTLEALLKGTRPVTAAFRSVLAREIVCPLTGKSTGHT